MIKRDSSLWKFHNPVHITAGVDSFKNLHKCVPEGKVLLITTNGFTRRGISNKVIEQLGTSRVIIFDHVTPNPELDALDMVTATLRKYKINSIIALGGGSVMDFAKVLSVTLPCTIDRPLEHFLRQSNPLKWEKKIVTIAIPTTSGTGAEVTPFATVWDATSHTKHSISGNLVYPSYALLDPELTLSLPRQQTLFTALDAISHALESLWNKNRTPISEAVSIQALSIAGKALLPLLNDLDNIEQRSRMQESSLLAGFAISQTRTAIAHSISYPLTSHYGVPHGLACSFILPALIYYVLSNPVCAAKLGSNQDIIKKTGVILMDLELGKYLSKYLCRNDLKKLMAQMSHSQRAKNFICDELDISSIIQTFLDS